MGLNLDLRQAIVKRVQDKTNQELREVIEGSIGGDDRALPGLGVLFEMIWPQTDKETQEKLIDTLAEQLKLQHV